MTYSEKFKDPRWQKKRLEILNRDNFMCDCCYDNKNTLHVHHRLYYKDRDPWDYDNILLVTLCDDCHSYQHKEEPYKRLLTIIFTMGISEVSFDLEEFFYLENKREPTKNELIDLFILFLKNNKNE